MAEYTAPDMMSEDEFDTWIDEKIAKKGEEGLAKFIAWQVYRQQVSCESMNEHMAKQNGTISELKEWQIEKDLELQRIRQNQSYVAHRVFCCLPKWAWVIIIAFAVVTIGANIELLSHVL